MQFAHRTALAGLAIAVVLLAMPPGVGAESQVDSLFDARPNGEVEVVGIAGQLTIRGWQRSEIHVRGSLGDGVDEIEIEQVERWTRLAIERPTEGERAADIDLSADLEIFVPADSSLLVSTLGAAVSIDGITGPVNVETVTGKIDAVGQPATATLRTVSGDLELQVDTAELTVRSVSGAITVRGEVGDLQAATVDAELHVAGSLGIEGRLSTVSGTLRFDANLAAVARLRARSTSGAVHVQLASTEATKVRLASFSGELYNAFGPGFGDGYRRQLEFGDGPRIVELETFDGPIHLQTH